MFDAFGSFLGLENDKLEAWLVLDLGSGACLPQNNVVDGALLTVGKGLLFFSIFARCLPRPGKNWISDWATVYKHWPSDETGIRLKWNASNLFKANKQVDLKSNKSISEKHNNLFLSSSTDFLTSPFSIHFRILLFSMNLWCLHTAMLRNASNSTVFIITNILWNKKQLNHKFN